MSHDIAISVRGLSKSYTINHDEEKHPTLAGTVAQRIKNPFKRSRKETFWALKEVSFDIKKGDVVGIIGRNGAGKSTLLKILSRITEPTSGEVDLYGRVGSLLEVGTGFSGELSGRENIYLNGAILGMTKREIRNQFDEIVDFAGVASFLDTPVKRYSSGMYVRLAFAVAAHLNPEILIVDEVLAVGDSEFQKKCVGKMKEVAGDGRTVLFVSHQLAAVEKLCNRGLFLFQGSSHGIEPIDRVIEKYRRLTENIQQDAIGLRRDRGGDQRVRAEELTVLDAEGRPLMAAYPGVPFRFRLKVLINETVGEIEASIDVNNSEGTRITTLYSGFIGPGFRAGSNCLHLECSIDELNLRPDRYLLNIWLGRGNETYDFVQSAQILEVETVDFFGSGKIPERPHGPLMSRFRWGALRLADA